MSRRIRRGRRGTDLPTKQTPSLADFLVGIGGDGKAFKTLISAIGGETSGTFNPVVQGTTTNPSVTYADRHGSWVQIGSLLFVSFSLRLSSRSGGSGSLVLNCPGMPGVNSTHLLTARTSRVNWPGSRTAVVAVTRANGTPSFTLSVMSANNATSTVTVANVDPAAAIDVTGVIIL